MLSQPRDPPFPPLLFVRNVILARTTCESPLPAPIACELQGSTEGLWFNWGPAMSVTISTFYFQEPFYINFS